MTAEQFISLGLSFFVGVTVVRYLGPEATGAFNYAGAIGGLLGPLATLGLESIIVRELARGGNDRSEVWQTACKLLWGVTILNTLILAWFALTQAPGSMQQIAVWATAVSSFSNLSTLHLWTFRAESRYREIAKLRLLQMVVLQSLRLAMVFYHAPFIAFAAIMAIDPLITAVTTSYLSRRRLGEVIGHSAANLERAKKLIAESWPLILTGFGIMVYMRIDLIMLEKFSSVRAVGVYAAATRVSELFYMAPVIVGRAAYPRMVRLRNESPAQFIRFYYIFVAFMVSVSAITIILIKFSGPWIITTIYGSKFLDSIAPFMVHIWTTLPVYMGVAVSNMYQIEGETRPQMYGCFAGAITNTVLNFYWIPRFETSGAAFATICAQTVAVIFPILAFRNCRRIALGTYLR